MVSKNKLITKTSEFEKTPHFSLRKLPIGLASVALGATMYASATTASADTVTSAAAQPAEEQTDTTATLPGTPVANDSQSSTAMSSVASAASPAQTAASKTLVPTSESSVPASIEANGENKSAVLTTPSATSNTTEVDSQSTSASNTIDPTSEVTLTYYVHDDDDNGKVVYKGTETMKPGQKFTYNEFKLPDNYILVGDGNGNIGSEDYKVDIHAKHRVVTLTAAKAIPIERTITIHYPDNSVKTITQTGSYQSPESELDEVTNVAKSVGKATLTGIDAYQVPEVDGYTPNIKEVPALTPEAYDGGAELLVNVSYTKNGTNPDSSSNNSNTASNSSSSEASSVNSNSSSSTDVNSSVALPGSNNGSEPSDSRSKNELNNDVAEKANVDDTNSAASAANTQASAGNDAVSGVGDNKLSSAITSNNLQATPAVTTASSQGVSSEPGESLVAQPGNTGKINNTAVMNGSNDSEGNESLPQTGNDVSKELAALGLGTLGVVGTATLGMRKKKY